MGQDGEDGQSGDADLTIARAQEQPPDFQREIREAIRYERGLFIKACLALAVVAVIVTLRTLYFT